jgi:endo-1,4-beta-xylanase
MPRSIRLRNSKGNAGLPSRRSALGLLAGAAVAAPATALAAGPALAADRSPAMTGAAPADVDLDLPSPSLRELAERRGLRIGTAIHDPAVFSNPRYAAILAREFSIVSPENVMKWDTVEPEHGLEDFTAAEHIFLPTAARDRQLVRGHNLVWHSQLPSWLSRTWTSAQLASFVQAHVTDEVSAFRGRIFAWDVVNEPLNEDGTLATNIWSTAVGPDYIATALQWAHAADPHARLYINDFNLEALGPKSDGMFALVQGLQKRGIPIHGVGFQGHLDVRFPFPSGMAANLQRFAALGIDVAITEADVRMPLPVTPAQLATQTSYYSQMLAAYLTVPDPVSFTVWGFADAYSWVDGFFIGEGAACLFDRNLLPKPAYFALRTALTT